MSNSKPTTSSIAALWYGDISAHNAFRPSIEKQFGLKNLENLSGYPGKPEPTTTAEAHAQLQEFIKEGNLIPDEAGVVRIFSLIQRVSCQLLALFQEERYHHHDTTNHPAIELQWFIPDTANRRLPVDTAWLLIGTVELPTGK